MSSFLNWGNPSLGTAGSKGNPLQFSPVTALRNAGSSMNPYMLGIGAVGGLLSYMNRPKDIGFEGSMSNFRESNYRTSPDLLRSIRGIGNRASTLSGYGDQFMDQYNQMIDLDSDFNRNQYNMLRGDIADSSSQSMNNVNTALAQRGIGNGGMSNLLSAVNRNQSNESLRRGLQGIQQQSIANAGQFGNMATGAITSAGNLAAQSAGLRNAIDARGLQNNQFNAQGRNSYQQYLDMGNYNAQVQNQNARASFNNNNLNFLGGLAGSIIGGGY
jgi:hypothetical protein